MSATQSLLSGYLLPHDEALPLTQKPVIAKAAQRCDEHYTDSLFAQCSILCPANIAWAIDKRRSEYFAGRYLAKLALTDMGIADFTVDTGEDRNPIWPAGVRGSITHTDTFALCVVAPEDHFTALGVDALDWMEAEQAERLTHKIVTPEEASLLRDSPLEYRKALSLCFSAKESLYKGLFPYVQEFFGFKAATLVAIDSTEQTLRFQMDEMLPNNPFTDIELDVGYTTDEARGITLLAAQR